MGEDDEPSSMPTWAVATLSAIAGAAVTLFITAATYSPTDLVVQAQERAEDANLEAMKANADALVSDLKRMNAEQEMKSLIALAKPIQMAPFEGGFVAKEKAQAPGVEAMAVRFGSAVIEDNLDLAKFPEAARLAFVSYLELDNGKVAPIYARPLCFSTIDVEFFVKDGEFYAIVVPK